MCVPPGEMKSGQRYRGNTFGPTLTILEEMSDNKNSEEELVEQQEPVSNMSLMLLFGVKVLCNPVLKYFMQTNQRYTIPGQTRSGAIIAVLVLCAYLNCALR